MARARSTMPWAVSAAVLASASRPRRSRQASSGVIENGPKQQGEQPEPQTTWSPAFAVASALAASTSETRHRSSETREDTSGGSGAEFGLGLLPSGVEDRFGVAIGLLTALED